MKIQRHKILSHKSTPRMDAVLSWVELFLYLATLIFTNSFGLFISSFISIKRNKEGNNGYIAFLLDKIISYTIKAPIFGCISIITFPSSLFAFIIWMILCKSKYKKLILCHYFVSDIILDQDRLASNS